MVFQFCHVIDYKVGVPGALFWFAPLQRNRTRGPNRKVGASAFVPRSEALLDFRSERPLVALMFNSMKHWS